MNRIGVKFSRIGLSKYISHLDMQRLFMRSIRRAQIAAKYSEGFNPHMNLSFAAPLAVGVETEGDYFEFTVLDDNVHMQGIGQSLNRSLPEGFAIEELGILPQGTKKLMALTQSARYTISSEDGNFFEWLEALFGHETYMITKVRKGKVKEQDIRPLIETYETVEKGVVTLQLANSGKATLSPLLLQRTAEQATGERYDLRIVRKELFYMQDGEYAALSTLFKYL